MTKSQSKNNEIYVGSLEDNRSVALKEKDYDDRELSFGTVKYLTREEADKSKNLFPNRDQKSTSACVCFAICTALYNTEKQVLSPVFFYTQRRNKPSEGCFYDDIASMAVNQGCAKEDDLHTPTTEIEINKVSISSDIKEKAKDAKQKSYVWITEVKDIDSVINKINIGIPVVVNTFAETAEWKLETPTISNPNLTVSTANVRHAIVALPYSGHIYNGKKYFIIQDSAKFGSRTFRYISEDWLIARMNVGLYFVDLTNEVVDTKLPFQYQWVRNLKVGDSGFDVLKLQQALQWLGFFPQGVSPTGYFGGITRQAVKDFQEAHANKILAFFGLTKGTGLFYTKTRELMNEYGKA